MKILVAAHDDSPMRMFYGVLGLTSAAISIATLSGPLSILAGLLGGAAAVREAAMIAETRVLIQQDVALFESLKAFKAKLAAELRNRGRQIG